MRGTAPSLSAVGVFAAELSQTSTQHMHAQIGKPYLVRDVDTTLWHLI